MTGTFLLLLLCCLVLFGLPVFLEALFYQEEQQW